MADMILDADRLIETVRLLERRIADRFPDSGLRRLCQHLLQVAEVAGQRSRWIGEPVWAIRWASRFVALMLVLLFIAAPFVVGFRMRQMDVPELVQFFEAGTNEVVLLGAGLFFLITLETRIKRRRALAAIHELRSISHIIDMHQLTKDPERLLRGWRATEHSPSHQMTPFELNRYLDYCSEMLSLTGKLAALYVQRFDDGVALAAVSEVESLCTSLSSKIWQKIMVLEQTPSSEYLDQS